MRGMVQVWEGRRRVREGRVQWRPLGLEVCQVATNAIVVRYGAGVGGVELVHVVRVREQVRCRVRREDLK